MFSEHNYFIDPNDSRLVKAENDFVRFKKDEFGIRPTYIDQAAGISSRMIKQADSARKKRK
jgi:hypothetical protein